MWQAHKKSRTRDKSGVLAREQSSERGGLVTLQDKTRSSYQYSSERLRIKFANYAWTQRKRRVSGKKQFDWFGKQKQAGAAFNVGLTGHTITVKETFSRTSLAYYHQTGQPNKDIPHKGNSWQENRHSFNNWWWKNWKWTADYKRLSFTAHIYPS